MYDWGTLDRQKAQYGLLRNIATPEIAAQLTNRTWTSNAQTFDTSNRIVSEATPVRTNLLPSPDQNDDPYAMNFTL